MSPHRYLLTASALLIAIFAGANLLAQIWLSSARADFTENQLYTLSDGTRTTLSDLAEPIDLTFVYTRDVGQEFPVVRAYAVRVRELLDAYQTLGGSNVRVREIDPAPFSEAEDEALAAGLVAVDTNGGDPLYFGLIGRNAVDDERVIPFLAPEQETSLEYDITRMLSRLDRPEPARIGLLSTLPGMNALTEETGYAIRREMGKNFLIEPIEENFVELPGEIDILMLVHPPELTEWQLWQIDQFILRTGRALILLDPAAKTAQGTGPFNMTNRQVRSDLDHFSGAWGIRLGEAAIADTETALSIEADTGDGRTTILQHPLFLAVPPGLMSPTNIVTADIARSVNLGAPGRLILSDTAPGVREILMRTGPAPSDMDPERAAMDLSAGDAIALYQASDIGAAPLAVRLTGALISAFPDGAPSPDLPDDPIYAELARAAAEEAPPHMATSAVDADIIVLADADMLDDGLHLDLQTGVPFADNAAFILNSLDSLSGRSELMSLRARAPGRRSMETVDRMREEAQARFFAEQARLEARLTQSQQRLEELQSVGAAGGFFDGDVGSELTEGERIELARLRENIIETRGRLREIERDFRREIDDLEMKLRLFTILGGPLLIGLIGLGLVFRKRRGATA
ncbi:MAG: GldG family protein [Henriciella sp.]|jgi:gliding motility-associatede transport system auxiliary component|nr:GldG family protein [Henriciella sp.]MBO6693844.1 GldG family protein [Henriciella sp.]